MNIKISKMKKSKHILLALLSTGVFFACAQTSETRKITSFSKVEAGGAVEIKLFESNLDYVKIESKENVSEKVKVECANGTLKVYTKGTLHNSVTVSVPYQKIEAIYADGATRITADKIFDAEKLTIRCSGASGVDLSFNTQLLSTDVSGAAQLKLKGKAVQHLCNLSGASNIEAQMLETESTRIVAGGASHAEVKSSKSLVVNADGASEVKYAGNPKDKQIQSGTASSVKTL
jgi:hypothetical protein